MTGEWEGNVGTPNNHFLGDGVYRGLDDGQRWERLPQNISSPSASAMVIDPGDGQRLYVAGSRGLHRSRDGDASWDTRPGHPFDTDANIREALAIAPTDPDRLLAVGKPGAVVYRSADAGSTWTETLRPVGTSITSVEFAPSDARRALAASADGRVWLTVDGGERWTELPRHDLPSVPVHDIEIDPRNSRRVFLAFAALGIAHCWRGDISVSDADAAWSDVSGVDGTALPDVPLTGLAIDPRDSATLYASNLLGVYRTGDGGRSWHPFDDGLPNTFVSDLDLHALGPTLYVSTMGRGVYRRRV